jgi:hypothetical protein
VGGFHNGHAFFIPDRIQFLGPTTLGTIELYLLQQVNSPANTDSNRAKLMKKSTSSRKR